MSQTSVQTEELSPLKRALVAIDKLQARIHELEHRRSESIAVVGMGCRLPGGVDSPDALWRLLEAEVDAISVIPSDRWEADDLYDPDPNKRGTAATRWGGFLEGIDQFDPDFFGISPREARKMDPQQRMLLEVSVEALEDAGISLEALSGSRAGVFVGAHSHSSDYSLLQFRDLREIDTYASTGTAHSILANRLSYVLNLQGPSLTVDTACSSSLVALHLAVQSLRNGECDVALASGVNLVLSPESTVAFSRLNMMASDGRCKTFDASADGFVRGEGCGVVVLKRLSEALASGDRILAVVRGSAVNQDGSTNGLTAPNGLSQQQVLRSALQNAGIDGSQVTYVETHGTGTALGDPIEVEALAAVLGRATSNSAPCVLGALKTNIGHLEGAAGIAGFIKAVLCLQRGKIPPNLHFRSLNPHITLDGTRFILAGTDHAWKRAGDRHVAGVSSFGFGGTNAHIVLEEWVQTAGGEEDEQGKSSSSYVLPLSARHPETLRAQSRAYATFLTSDAAPSLRDICFTASVRRAHLPYRLAVVGRSEEEIARLLNEAAERSLPLVGGDTRPDGIVFVFSGQGSQWPGMGRSLLEKESAFRAAIDACDQYFRPLAGWSIVERLMRNSEEDLSRTDVVQPLLFGVQIGLAALWAERGIRPDAVIGHSFGEVAAAHVAGALSLEDAVTVIYHRGRLMQDAGAGRMAAVGLPAADLEPVLTSYDGRVSIGAYNGPASTVITGDSAAVEEIAGALEQRGVFVRLLQGAHAFHSPQMEGAAGALGDVVRGITPRAPMIPFFSTVDGAQRRGEPLDGAYWSKNVRQPVRFAQALEAAAANHYAAYLEIAPHPVLGTPMKQVLEQQDDSSAIVASMRRSDDVEIELLRAVASLYEAGASIEWTSVSQGGRVVSLPRHVWRHDRYWLPASKSSSGSGHLATGKPVNRFLGARIDAAVPFFEASLRGSDLSIQDRHGPEGQIFMPFAGFIEMAAAAGRNLLGDVRLEVLDLQVLMPLALDDEAYTKVQLVPRDIRADQFEFDVFRREDTGPGGSWVKHITGSVRVSRADALAPVFKTSIEAIRERTSVSSSKPQSQDRFAYHGADPSELIGEIRRGDGEVLCRISGSEGNPDDRLAVALWSALEILPADQFAPLVATGLRRAELVAEPGEIAWCHAVHRSTTSATDVEVDVTTFDEHGKSLHLIQGLRFTQVETHHATGDVDKWLYRVEWDEESVDAGENGWLPEPGKVTSRLSQVIEEQDEARLHRRYLDLLPGLDRLCGAYVRNAFLQLGHSFDPSRVQTIEQIATELAILPRFLPLLRRLLGMLEIDGLLQREGDVWVAITDVDSVDVSALADELLESYPECAPELEIARKCGERLAEVLSGQTNPLTLLFPDGSQDLAARVYADAPFSAPFAALVGEAMAAVAENLGSDQRLAVLEIGAGTGGTTDQIYARVSPDRLRYAFTDISPAFIKSARAHYAGMSEMQFQLLDIEKDPIEQGFQSHGYDVIVAANVLHATSDLARTLRHVRTLLKPGGMLLLQEVTFPARWIELTFGLTDGWWRFTDSTLRSSQPLLSPELWSTVLRDAGFGEVERVGVGDEAYPYPSAQTIICARNAVSSDAADFIVVVGDASGVAEALADRCRAENLGIVLTTGHSNAESIIQQAVRESQGDCRAVVYLRSLAARADADADMLAGDLAELVHLVGALANESKLAEARLWTVTECAQCVVDADAARVTPAQSTYWGLGRVATLEHPLVWGGLIDLPARTESSEAARYILDAIRLSGEDQIAYRNGKRYLARLRRAEVPDVPPLELRGDCTYLITGGTGSVGIEAARWMVAQGARHLVLTGRKSFEERRRDAEAGDAHARRLTQILEAIREEGAEVEVASVDVSDQAGMTALFERFNSQMPPLAGILHLAVDFGMVEWSDLDANRVRSALRPKLDGTVILERLSDRVDLDFFVTFSSSAALLGARGQGHYAAANAYQDAFAHRQRASGRRAVSIGWGMWEEVRALADAVRIDMVRGGLKPMDSAEALQYCLRLAAGTGPHYMVADVDWAVMKPLLEARRARPFLRDIETVDARPSVAPREGTNLRDSLDALAGDERRALLLQHIRKAVGAALGIENVEEIDPNRGFFESGFDSLLAMEVRGALQKALRLELPATLLFTYPTINSLTDRILWLVYGGATVNETAPKIVRDQENEEDLSALSEADLSALLEAELAAVRHANGR